MRKWKPLLEIVVIVLVIASLVVITIMATKAVVESDVPMWLKILLLG